MRYYRPQEPLLGSLVAPVQRLRHGGLPDWSHFWAVLAASVQFLLQEAFVPLLVLVLVASYADWHYGVRASERSGEFDADVARFGRDGKIAGILILLLVWCVEWWAATYTGIDTRGAGAVALGVWTLAAELRSLNNHREALGSQSWPFLDRVLRLLREIPERLLPHRDSDPPDREPDP
jgi:hypothetical protein